MGQKDLIAIIGKAVTDKEFLDELCENLENRDTQRAAVENFLKQHGNHNLDEKELEYFLTNREINISQCLRMFHGCLAIEYDKPSARKRK